MFEKVYQFEKSIAKFYNAPYAVATDSCTHAIELCLRHKKFNNITIPTRTYISIAFLPSKLNINWNWDNNEWKDYYYLGNTNIIDAAVHWKKGGYISGTFMCLSFQFQKHLSLGRGGMILCEKKEDFEKLKKMSYDGRLPDIPWREQNIDSIGFHYYMTPETAMLGINKLEKAKNSAPREWVWKNWPDLSRMDVFQ
tara:strand:- start:731 stop:1318 length:588 start_codon:yes stop_codon:yes gene_type:complete